MALAVAICRCSPKLRLLSNRTPGYLILFFHTTSCSPRTISGYWKELLSVISKASIFSGAPLLSNQRFARQKLPLILGSGISNSSAARTRSASSVKPKTLISGGGRCTGNRHTWDSGRSVLPATPEGHHMSSLLWETIYLFLLLLQWRWPPLHGWRPQWTSWRQELKASRRISGYTELTSARISFGIPPIPGAMLDFSFPSALFSSSRVKSSSRRTIQELRPCLWKDSPCGNKLRKMYSYIISSGVQISFRRIGSIIGSRFMPNTRRTIRWPTLRIKQRFQSLTINGQFLIKNVGNLFVHLIYIIIIL